MLLSTPNASSAPEPHLASSPADNRQPCPSVSPSVAKDALAERGAWSWQPHNLILLRLGQTSALRHPPSPGANVRPSPLPSGAVRPHSGVSHARTRPGHVETILSTQANTPGLVRLDSARLPGGPRSIWALTTLGAVFRAHSSRKQPFSAETGSLGAVLSQLKNRFPSGAFRCFLKS